MNFITCKNCIGAFFCNDNCLKKSFHKYECNMPNGLSRKETFELVLKMFFNINTTFSSVDGLMNTVKVLLKGETPSGLTSEAQKKFCIVFQVEHNHERKTVHQLDRLRAASAVAIIVIRRFAEFRVKFATTKHQRFLQHLILHLFHIAENAVHLYELYNADSNVTMPSSNDQQFANAMYPFSCYINHSCVPNVLWFNVDSRFICKVIRPIKSGEQLFRSYL